MFGGGESVRSVWGCFVRRLGVRCVLPTFETVVMYRHFNESRSAWCRQIVEIYPKFPVFRSEVQNGVM